MITLMVIERKRITWLLIRLRVTIIMPKLMFFNANGLAGKADGVLRFVKEQSVDCCFIVETWLRDTDSTGRLRPFVKRY